MRVTILHLSLLPLLATAQIPNGGFETWVDQGSYLDPMGWLTYNEIPTVGGPTVEQGTPGHPGGFHAVITTRQSPGGVMAIQGWLSVGTSSSHAGFPYAQRPAMLTGQWQYGIQPFDTAQVQVALSKWNSVTSSTDLIAFGSLEVTGTLATWQAFSVPLDYLGTGIPDTAFIQIVSSTNFLAPVPGSFVKVDDLAFSGSTGVGEQDPSTRIHVFPNPGTIHFSLSLPPGPHTITLLDATCRVVNQQRTTDPRPLVSTEALPAGLYRISVRDGSGRLTGTTWVKE